jgi:hypothetical protein
MSLLSLLRYTCLKWQRFMNNFSHCYTIESSHRLISYSHVYAPVPARGSNLVCTSTLFKVTNFRALVNLTLVLYSLLLQLSWAQMIFCFLSLNPCYFLAPIQGWNIAAVYPLAERLIVNWIPVVLWRRCNRSYCMLLALLYKTAISSTVRPGCSYSIS